MPLRIGIDTYSYHRLLGDVRPGEDDPSGGGWESPFAALEHARALGVDGVSLETCFLGPPARLDVDRLREAAGPLELALAWGHPHGLELGTSAPALRELLDWLALAPRLGCGIVRCVVASPRFLPRRATPEELARTVRPLTVAASQARELGLTLALENHGDLRACEIATLLDRVGGALAVCFDTANALRVGDDVLEAAALLAPHTRMVHLKDVEPLHGVTDPVAGPCSVLYGEGVVPVAAVLATLEAAGFDGLACVEVAQLPPGADELDLVAGCVDWLRAYASSNG